eukprot:Rmarinus@m.18950
MSKTISCDDVCVICEKTEAVVLNEKFYQIRLCGHFYCSPCLNRWLGNKVNPQCSKCRRSFSKADCVEVRPKEEVLMEQELQVRDRVMKELYLREKDFATVDEYNDYLEELEEIIDDTIQVRVHKNKGIDQKKVERRLKDLKDKHADLVILNRAQRDQETITLDNHIRAEEQKVAARRQRAIEEELERRRSEKSRKEAAISRVMAGRSKLKAPPVKVEEKPGTYVPKRPPAGMQVPAVFPTRPKRLEGVPALERSAVSVELRLRAGGYCASVVEACCRAALDDGLFVGVV